MAEDGIPEILAEQRLGHQVPGMRGLYVHASDRMRDDLKQALQARWQESLEARAAINPHSLVPLLDEQLARLRVGKPNSTDLEAPRKTQHHRSAPDDREKMISQIPPKSAEHPARAAGMEGPRRASDVVRHQIRSGGANETRTRDPLLAKQVLFQLSYSPSASRAAGALQGTCGSRPAGAWPNLSRYSGDIPWQLMAACCSWQLERMTVQQLVRLSSECSISLIS
jgi:hypothetical protein